MATGNFYASLLAAGIAVLSASPTQLRAQQDTVSIGNHDLGGVVTSATGVEAGVWVIAETTDLPTKMAKIVVTRCPRALPHPRSSASQLHPLGPWIRIGRLRQSPISAWKDVNLNAVVAPNSAAAAEYYPAIYWYSMLEGPGQRRVSGHGNERQRPAGNPQEPVPMVGHRQDERVLHVPSARQ